MSMYSTSIQGPPSASCCAGFSYNKELLNGLVSLNLPSTREKRDPESVRGQASANLELKQGRGGKVGGLLEHGGHRDTKQTQQCGRDMVEAGASQVLGTGCRQESLASLRGAEALEAG